MEITNITNRTPLLIYICNKRKAESYLEIGVRNPNDNFNLIQSESLKTKIGVDPDKNAHATYTMTSDEYFQFLRSSASQQKFDVVFIDGLHHSDQLLKDIENSLSFLTEKGIIICHDCLPANEYAQTYDIHSGVWNGDCWKAFATFCSTTKYRFFTLDFSHGFGIIDTTKQRDVPLFTVPSIDKLEWKDYKANRNVWLNIKHKDYILQYEL